MHTDDIVDSLNRLIETNTDGELGFRQCATHARDLELARFLHDRADTCHHAAAELRGVIVELGGSAEDGGSAGGALHRGWLAMKAALGGYSDELLLDTCERAEDEALGRYREALEEPLPRAVLALIERQYAGLKRSHADLRSLRELERART